MTPPTKKREIKFRAWDKLNKEMTHFSLFERPTACYGKEVEIMQFTGLLDKSGKEIYEGDIIEYMDRKSLLVGWNENQNGWNFRNHQKGYPMYWKIIGNIYQNPELLK